jgi:adenylate cyclase
VRKLTTIMAGDVVGYSRLMAEDEAGTYADVRAALDEVIEPCLERHGGRAFKHTGDGFLAAFSSVNGALDAAIAIQSGFATRPLKLRIGLNLGDVIEDGGDAFGDGVNVAARLESIAEPGSIYASAAVVRSADKNRQESFDRIGRRRLKNIPHGVEVFAVRQSGATSAAGTARSVWRSLGRYRWALPAGAGAAAVALLAILLGGGLSSPAQVLLKGEGTRNAVAATDARATVAVLPFDNMSGDPAQAYFVDGLTEDVIAQLARNRELAVIARNSTFAMRERRQDVRDIGAALGARYVVEGSARRSGDQVRVVAQLIDASTGSHLWSRSYDRGIDDVFGLQSDLTAEIVASLVSYVRATEISSAASRPTGSSQAYDLVLQARSIFKPGSTDGRALLDARALYSRAIELDPAYAAAHASLGLTYIVDRTHGATGAATEDDLDIGLMAARRAIQLAPDLPLGYQVLSFGLAAKRDFEGGMRAAEQAVELNPSDPDSLIALAKAQVRFNAYAQAVRNAERARRLHPLAPEYFTYVHGQALYAAGETEEAARVLGECLIRAPRDASCLRVLIAVQVRQGRLVDASESFARALDSDPEFSLASEREYRRFGDTALMNRFLTELELAQAAEAAVRQRS